MTVRLYTFTISHFSEKIRWLLDDAGLAYEERPLTPGLHMPRTLWLSRRGTSVPILEIGGRRLQDSRRIVRALAERDQLGALLPAEAGLREQALAIEAAQNEIGTAVMRVVYERLIEEPELLDRLWTLDAGWAERRLLRTLLPGIREAFRRRFGVDAASIAAAGEVIERRLAEIETRIAEGRAYLVGDSFSVADLATAALLAPIAAPDEHPVYGAPRARASMSAQVQSWYQRPALRWVRGLYRTHRPPIAPGSALAAARGKLEAA